MSKLIVLLFFLISTPVLAIGETRTELELRVFDIVYAMGKPDHTTAFSQYLDGVNSYWFHKHVTIVCGIKTDYEICWMDITLEELQALKINLSSIVKLRRKLGMTPVVKEDALPLFSDAPTVEILDCVLYPDDC